MISERLVNCAAYIAYHGLIFDVCYLRFCRVIKDWACKLAGLSNETKHNPIDLGGRLIVIPVRNGRLRDNVNQSSPNIQDISIGVDRKIGSVCCFAFKVLLFSISPC